MSRIWKPAFRRFDSPPCTGQCSPRLTVPSPRARVLLGRSGCDRTLTANRHRGGKLTCPSLRDSTLPALLSLRLHRPAQPGWEVDFGPEPELLVRPGGVHLPPRLPVGLAGVPGNPPRKACLLRNQLDPLTNN